MQQATTWANIDPDLRRNMAPTDQRADFVFHDTVDYVSIAWFHDDVINWKLFRVTGLLCGESTGDRWKNATGLLYN